LSLGIWKAFQANGIKIPFPQREVRLLGNVAPSTKEAPFESRFQPGSER
jgi:small-conductance mechanosensitive channel